MKRGIKNRLFTQAAAFPGQLSGFPFVSSGRDISIRSLLKILKCWMNKVLDEAGRLLRSEASRKGDRFEAKWYYRAQNTRRTFHIHYRLRGGIVSYPQVSELYWQIIGSGWDKPTRSVIINVHLPEPVEDKKDILVFGHGPLSGKAIIVDRSTACFTVSNLQAHQYVEIRMIWPAGMVSGVPSSRHTLASIKREEAAFVQKTIERARQAQETSTRKKKTFRYILYG